MQKELVQSVPEEEVEAKAEEQALCYQTMEAVGEQTPKEHTQLEEAAAEEE